MKALKVIVILLVVLVGLGGLELREDFLELHGAGIVSFSTWEPG